MLRFPVYESTGSYLPHAWKGIEEVTHSPWPRGVYNRVAEKANLIFSSREQKSYIVRDGMVMNLGSRGRETWVQVPALPLTSYTTWGVS